ncbi:DUF4347 domain-containing protein, partial [Sphingomonadaceae bacterium]|nr:DUF4347 domain-containing protein [Sphingomonadaceae bacterium]
MMFDGAGVVTAMAADPAMAEIPEGQFSLDSAIAGPAGMDLRADAPRSGMLRMGLSTPGGTAVLPSTFAENDAGQFREAEFGLQLAGDELGLGDADADADFDGDIDTRIADGQRSETYALTQVPLDDGASDDADLVDADSLGNEATVPNDYIFINSDIENYEQLVAEWEGRGTIVLIDGDSDGIDQILTALAGASDIGAIHLVSHGDDGVFWLGDTRIDTASVNGELASAFASIGSKLSADGDILIY